MTLTRTFPTDRAAGLPLADTRLLVAAMVESDTTGKPRAGVLPSHYNPLVTGTTGMAYSVAAFSAVTARAGMGAELVANDGAATVATTAAPGANSRIDVIWVRSLFTTTGDAATDPVFGVTQGVAAASPSKPSIPAGALELATAVVLSTTTQTSTAVITQTYPYTAMRGGVVPVRNSAELAAWAPAAGNYADIVADPNGANGLYRRDGAAWVLAAAATGQRWFACIPSAVVGGTVNADGSVSPSGQAKNISIDGVISPQFKKYRIIVNLTLSQGDGPTFRWVKNGAVVSTGDYWGNLIGATGSGGVGVGAISGITGVDIATAPTTWHTLELGVSRADGFIAAIGTCLSTGGSFGQRQIAFDYEGAMAPVTGLYISCPAATILATSRISVYGIA